MTPNCHRHGWEIADDACADCGLAFCGSCLFYVTRSQDQPMCVPCALARAGVRKGRQPRISRKRKREIALALAHRRDARVLADAAAVEAELEGVPDVALQPTWTSLDDSNWEVRPA